MTATSPKVASWQCCAAPQRELGVLGLWGNAPNGSSRTEGSERLASLEQTQPYHEVCGMGAWRAWFLLSNLDHELSCPWPPPTATTCPYTSIRPYVFLPSLPSTIRREGRGRNQPGRTRLRPGPWAVSRGIRWSRKARAGNDRRPAPSPCTRTIHADPPSEPLCPRRLGGGPNERCRASGLS